MRKKNYLIWSIVIGLVISILGLTVSQSVKTNFGKTNVTEIKTISQSGFEQSMEVYVPQGVSADKPAPAIVIQHGGNNNKEEMELYAIELSRRGYVAITNDMYSMGNSEALPDSQWLTSARGLYDAVKYARTLPYVDADNISTLGYSRGGIASSESMKLDQENKYIKNMFIIHADPYYTFDGGYGNGTWYQDRNVAVVADKYDEFFFVFKNFEGGYSNDANKYDSVKATSVDYITRERAQSFLYFGEDPTAKEARESDTVYTKVFPNGKEVSRIIYVTPDTHMTPWFASHVVEKAVTFFQTHVPTSTNLGNSDFIYPIDNFFSVIGMLGLLIFMISLALFMVLRVVKLKDTHILTPELKETGGAKGMAWLWALMTVITVFIFFVIRFINSQGWSAYRDGLFLSANPIYHGLIGIVAGTFSLLISIIWYRIYGKKNGFDLETTGLFINRQQLMKTILIAVTSVVAMYAVVFTANHLFGAKLLFAYWHIIPFSAARVPGMFAVLPLYIIFYVGMSIVVNAFDYTKALTKFKWLNHTLISFLSALPPLVVIIYVYGRYYATGQNPMFGGLASAAVAVLPLPVFIFFAILATRIIYSKTGNMYLGGIIGGITASIIEWSVCEIRMPEVGSSLSIKPGVYGVIIVCIIVFAASMVYLYKTRRSIGKS